MHKVLSVLTGLVFFSLVAVSPAQAAGVTYGPQLTARSCTEGQTSFAHFATRMCQTVFFRQGIDQIGNRVSTEVDQVRMCIQSAEVGGGYNPGWASQGDRVFNVDWQVKNAVTGNAFESRVNQSWNSSDPACKVWDFTNDVSPANRIVLHSTGTMDLTGGNVTSWNINTREGDLS